MKFFSMGEEFLLAVGLSALVIALAVYGGILAVPPKTGKERSRHHVWAFVVMGLLAFGISVRQAYKAAVFQQKQEKLEADKEERDRQNTEHMKKAKETLAGFMVRGQKLTIECSNVGIGAKERAWVSQAHKYINENVGIAEAEEFMHSSTLMPFGVCFSRINARVSIIEKLIDRLN